MLEVKILLKGEKIMKNIKAFKMNRILMELKKPKKCLRFLVAFCAIW